MKIKIFTFLILLVIIQLYYTQRTLQFDVLNKKLNSFIGLQNNHQNRNIAASINGNIVIGDPNYIDGRNNQVQGSYNSILGNSNFVRGNNNIIRSSKKPIQSENIITISGNQNVASKTPQTLVQNLPIVGQPVSIAAEINTIVPVASINTNQTSTFKDQTISKQLQIIAPFVEIDKLINSGNTIQLLIIIKNVISSNINCQTKIAYLNDLFGRFLIAIQIKKFYTQNQQVILMEFLAQIERFNAQIQQIKNKKSTLSTLSLEQQLESLLTKLKTIQSSLNNSQKEQVTNNNDLNNLKIQLNNHEKRLADNIRLNSDNDRKLSTVNNQIKNLQIQLNKLKTNKALFEKNSTNFKKNINDGQKNISDTKNKIDNLNKKINESKQTYKSNLIDRNQTQNNIISVKKNIQNTNASIRALDKKITQYTNQITKNKEQINNKEARLEMNLKIYKILTQWYHQIRDIINQAFYKCMDVTQIKIKAIEGQDSNYQLGDSGLTLQLKKGYNYSSEDIIAAPIELNQFSIFSKIFRKTYDFGFTDQIKTSAKVSNPLLSFNGDFSCYSTYLQISSKSGIIKTITNRYIQVEDENKVIQRLILGACSRMQIQVTNSLPKIGDKIVYRGSKTTEGTALHSASIIL